MAQKVRATGTHEGRVGPRACTHQVRTAMSAVMVVEEWVCGTRIDRGCSQREDSHEAHDYREDGHRRSLRKFARPPGEMRKEEGKKKKKRHWSHMSYN